MKIELGRELNERYTLYAKITNQSVASVIRHALEDWMDTCGEGDIEVITGVPRDSEAHCIPLPVAEHSAALRLLN
jgi:hypothetical protein